MDAKLIAKEMGFDIPTTTIRDVIRRQKTNPMPPPSELRKAMDEYLAKFGENDINNAESSLPQKTWVKIIKFCIRTNRPYSYYFGPEGDDE